MTPLLAGLLAAGCATLALLAVPLLLDRGPTERFALEQGPARGSILRKLVESLSLRFGPRLSAGMPLPRREKLSRKLDLAGRPGGMHVERFVGIKAALVALVGGGCLLLALLGFSPLLPLMGAGAAWILPDFWLSRLGRLRQERIERDLPDFLDILAVTVRAGLGYRSAVRRVSESLGGPVGEEMLTALRQMELGAKRREAFLALRDRNDSEALRTFVGAQLQAEELGVPLSDALNDIATDMRRAAHQSARRRAARAAPRVALIVTTLIVPGSIILMLVSMVLGTDLTGAF